MINTIEAHNPKCNSNNQQKQTIKQENNRIIKFYKHMHTSRTTIVKTETVIKLEQYEMQHLLLYLYYHWSRTETIEPYKYKHTLTHKHTEADRMKLLLRAEKKEKKNRDYNQIFTKAFLFSSNRICSRSEAKTKRDFLQMICFVMHHIYCFWFLTHTRRTRLYTSNSHRQAETALA